MEQRKGPEPYVDEFAPTKTVFAMVLEESLHLSQVIFKSLIRVLRMRKLLPPPFPHDRRHLTVYSFIPS